MFHVMLVLPALILLAILIAILLFGIFSVVISVLGGASTAIFVKNRILKRMLFVVSGILSFFGLICLIPFITIYGQLPELFFTFATIAAFACISILAAFGIKISTAVQNKAGKIILIVVFSLVLATAISCAIFIPIVSGFLMSS